MRVWPPAVLRERAARMAELHARAEAASQEKEQSERRRQEAEREVIGPLQAAGERNRFADLIRHSLLEGHQR